MIYSEARLKRDQLEDAYADAKAKLNMIPGIDAGPFGLTPDSIKFSDRYKCAKFECVKTFNALRAFNRDFVREFSAELLAERRARSSPVRMR